MTQAFALAREDGRLVLRARNHPRFGPVLADWRSPALWRRIRAGRRQALARAVGFAPGADPIVVDATAGLGGDGFVLAALGAQVTLVERNACMVELLRDAWQRAAADAECAPAAARIRIEHADAREWLPGAPACDAVLLDPMYPATAKRALAAKELQLLRELTGGDPDAAELLAPALARARRRVAVKRPSRAPPLAGRAPSYSLPGTLVRFDVYLSSAATSPACAS